MQTAQMIPTRCMDRAAGGGAVSGDGGDGDGGDGGGDGGVGGGGCGGCDGCCGGGDEADSGGDGEGAADAPWGASSHHNTSARPEESMKGGTPGRSTLQRLKEN
eukprot:scaffold42659_cov62-Phaeocystis_antarctica.AAC.18